MRVNFKQLRGRAGLMPLDNKKVEAAGFTDESCSEFIATFVVGENGAKRDLLISFESRTPQIFVSNVYREEQEVKRKAKQNKTVTNNIG